LERKVLSDHDSIVHLKERREKLNISENSLESVNSINNGSDKMSIHADLENIKIEDSLQ
jgi:hypothetical protein